MRSVGDNLSVWEFKFEVAYLLNWYTRTFCSCLCVSNLLSLILFQYSNKSYKNITTFTVYMYLFCNYIKLQSN